MRRNNVCSDDLIVPEMLMSNSGADWHRAGAFNKIIANIEGDPTRVVYDGSFDHFSVHLWQHATRLPPTLFKLLRPIAILKASSKLWSWCFYGALEAYHNIPSPAHLGFIGRMLVQSLFWLFG